MVSPRRRAAALVLAAGCALSACAGGEPASAPTQPTSASESTSVPTTATSSAAASPTAKPSPTMPAYEEGKGISLRVLPRIADAGPGVRQAAAASHVVEATIEGAGAGRLAQLQTKRGGEWVTVARGRTGPMGIAMLTYPPVPPARVISVQGKTAVGARVDYGTVAPLIFSDEFDSDSGMWGLRDQGYLGVRSCSRASASASQVAGGVMRLQVLDDPARGRCPYDGGKHDYRLNGHVGTQGRFDFTYGIAAARIKFQPSRGQHGAFWMQSNLPSAANGPKVDGAEVDVVEYFGDGHPKGGLTSFIYYYPGGGQPAVTVGDWIPDPQRFGSDWASQFHVFSVEWTPYGYTFRIDGQITRRLTEGVSGARQYLILSLLSSDYELKHSGSLPQTMEVDWVRVWQG